MHALQPEDGFLPYYFSFSMQNYATYVSFYVELLSCIDELHPGLRTEFLVGVQSQDRYPHKTAIDQWGDTGPQYVMYRGQRTDS